MEEQKIGSKEVKMQAVVNPEGKASGTPAQKTIEEELQGWTKEKLIQQLVQMNQQLYNQDRFINQLKTQANEMGRALSTYNRLDYLFKVVETANNNKASDYPCFAKDFVENCLAEIQETLTIPEQQEEETKEH